jgi:hypothetical protein
VKWKVPRLRNKYEAVFENAKKGLHRKRYKPFYKMVGVAIQNFLKNPVIPMVCRPPISEITSKTDIKAVPANTFSPLPFTYSTSLW